MNSSPKIVKAVAHQDRTIEIYYSTGEVGSFNFEEYYDYRGYYEFLKDISNFKQIQVDQFGHNVYWMNKESDEEIELDPAIMYAIISQQKIIIDNKVVFDPSLGKAGWL